MELKLAQGLLTEEQYAKELNALRKITEEKVKAQAVDKTFTELAQERLDREAQAEAVQREYVRLKLEELGYLRLANVITQEEYEAALARLETERNIVDTQDKQIERAVELGDVLRGIGEDWLATFEAVLRIIGQISDQEGGFGGFLRSFGGGGATPGQHAGGGVRGGQAYRVNEPVTELFVPSVGGRVLSRSDALSLAGGGGDTYITLQGIDYGANWAEQAVQQAGLVARVVGEAAR